MRGRWAAAGVLVVALAVAGCGTEVPVELVPERPNWSDTLDQAPEKPPVGVDHAFRLPAVQKAVETYDLQIPEATLKAFEDNVWLKEQPATFLVDGKPQDVMVRLRGGSARFFDKKSWRVEFPTGTKFQGRRKLNLVAEAVDETLMAEKLAFDVLAAMGAPSPRAKYVRLNINGNYQGVYLDIER
ncbi:MAG: CotH kinase family protein, partial [Myxococcales bacterium]